MKTTTSVFTGLVAMAAVLYAVPAIAQNNAPADTTTKPAPAPTAEAPAAKAEQPSLVQSIEIGRLRAVDQRGINVYETPKNDGIPYTGFKLGWGAAFTQQFQGLNHSSTAQPNMQNGVHRTQLIKIGNGFNNAVANLYLDAQLAKGIRVENTIYLSSRHHQETWVKDGYLLIDGSPWENATLDNLMKYLTLRVGHMEINYGDAHFRRTDNGNAMYNPLIGNLIVDAFTTEIGAEAYVRHAGFLGMVGATGGEVRGTITRPNDRAASYLLKAGYDGNPVAGMEDFRFRLTGSMYTTKKSASNTLFTGDRAGSRYYGVTELARGFSETGNAWSGNLRSNLNFSSEVTAIQINPFIKFQGLELFGVVEMAKGRTAAEVNNDADKRELTQYAVEGVYRMFDESLYLAARYNTVDAELLYAGPALVADVNIDRTQIGFGWFITPTIEMKAEWVQQNFNDFPARNGEPRNGAKFDGIMIEGVVAF